MKKSVIAVVVVLGGILLNSFAFAQSGFEIVSKRCQETFDKTKICPSDLCETRCEAGDENCGNSCHAKHCRDIAGSACPSEFCQKRETCDHKTICMEMPSSQEPQCGQLGYDGAVACCSGLQKKCGVEYYDGTCNMTPTDPAYLFPVCLPCGDGVCNQFENRCNCPEDCGKTP